MISGTGISPPSSYAGEVGATGTSIGGNLAELWRRSAQAAAMTTMAASNKVRTRDETLTGAGRARDGGVAKRGGLLVKPIETADVLPDC